MQYLYDIGYLHIIVYQYVAEEKLSNGEIFKSAWSFILSLSISTNCGVCSHHILVLPSVFRGIN